MKYSPFDEKEIIVAARFGDKFLTRDGHLAIYRDEMKIRGSGKVNHILIVDKSPELTMLYDRYGHCITRNIPKFDIVSRYEDEDYLKDVVKIRAKLKSLETYNTLYGTEHKDISSVGDDWNNRHFDCSDLSAVYEKGFIDGLNENGTYSYLKNGYQGFKDRNVG